MGLYEPHKFIGPSERHIDSGTIGHHNSVNDRVIVGTQLSDADDARNFTAYHGQAGALGVGGQINARIHRGPGKFATYHDVGSVPARRSTSQPSNLSAWSYP